MTIILFLVDTSASMCQKAYVNGVQKSYLDIAKGAVETFLKYRQRSQDCMGDRYMLLTFEDPPSNVKAGWKENHATFMNELKNLQSTGLTSMSEALRNAFDLLNLNRMQSGIDTYGQGRCPFYLEPSVIIVITDGGKYTFKNGVHQEIVLPLNTQTTGVKLTKEPFRWDQRLFSLVLRIAGNKVDERVEGKVPHDDSPIEKMCEVTGGRSYRVKSHYVLNQCIESLVQKVQPGVVVQFDQLLPKDLKDGEIQDITFGTTKKMIYVQKHATQKSFPVGFWPIPEPYWPDPKANTLPSRDAHPKLRILTPCVEEPPLVRNFPIDKYDVEASPLTLQILSKREATKCWPVIVSNGTHGLEMPFGYLKASPNFTQVYLMILPYNYGILLPLLTDLFHKFVLNPPSDWVYKFSAYIRSIPQYYAPFLRRALVSASVPFQLLQYILPESLDSYLSPAVANYLKTMKNTAKQEQENMCLRVFKQLKIPKPPYHQVETVKLNCGFPIKRDLVSHPQLKDTFAKMHTEVTVFENYTIVVPTVIQQSSAKNFRNPFDVPRRDLVDEIARMRENFLKIPTSGINIYTKDAGHCLPISEMGNYQEYLKNKQSPLREIEPTNVRQHMFGNPYKKDKHMVMVDEADVGDVAPMKPNGNGPNKKLEQLSRPRKRKAGPIGKDYIFRRKSTDSFDSMGSFSPSSSSSSMGSASPSHHTDDDQSMSDTSSTRSDDDGENDLIIDFDIDEPSIEDYNINGHVQSFINGESEDIDETTPLNVLNSSLLPLNVASQQHLPPQIANLPPHSPPPSSMPAIIPSFVPQSPLLLNSVAPMQPIPPTIPTNIVPPNAPFQQHHHHHLHHHSLSPLSLIPPSQQQLLLQQSQATSPMAPSSPTPAMPPMTSQIHQLNGPPSATTVHQSHQQQQNDYEAQEISKILQQCTNGMDQQRYGTHDKKEVDNKKADVEDDDDDDDNGDKKLSVTADVHRKDDSKTTNGIQMKSSTETNSLHKSKSKLSTKSTKDTKESVKESIVKVEFEECAVAAAAAAVADDEQKENIKQSNLEIRSVIFKDIRRPGRDYSTLLEHLTLVKGSLETRFSFIQMCINESLRFRRKKMADSIQEWWDKQFDKIQIVST